MNRNLHIVCLDAPSPPDYGGALDMHFKIKTLANSGCKIRLHFFAYRHNRGAQGLEESITESHAYSRRHFLSSLPVTMPYIVGSRINRDLILRLNQDDHPILLEGLHCAGIIPFIKSPQRIVLRMHNNEPAYYRSLAKTETSSAKRMYLLWEGELLHRFQLQLSRKVKLACLSETDQRVFQDQYGFQQAAFVPCFHPWNNLQNLPGKGDYCLYHGNLQVSENEQAALWLVQNVFSQTKMRFIVAGKGASVKLQKEVARLANAELRNNPSIAEIDLLVREAQVNVLPSLNNTGVKLKLLNALFNGRHCVVNQKGVQGSGISNGVSIAETPAEWQQQIENLMQRPFQQEETETRRTILSAYDNSRNAERLSELW